MSVSRIIFFPASTSQLIENNLIMTTLTRVQFTETTTRDHSQHLPAEHFLSLLTFLGCSPNINLSPAIGEADSHDYCTISLLEQSPAPRCPLCKKRITGWKSASWQQNGQICTCDKCHTETTYANLSWKHECGFGCCGFEVTHIYPHEAVPTDQLLNALQQSTGFQWQYCYANN